MKDGATTIYVCMNTDCKSRGAQSVIDALQAHLEKSGKTEFKVEPYICFSACNSGPNVVVTEQRCWLSGVQPGDAKNIVHYLQGGPPVERLQGKNDSDLEEMIFGLIDAGLISD